MRIRWHGHSCFEISTEGTTIVLDPHDGKSLGIKTPSATADLVLISHDHYDHNASRSIDGNFKTYSMKNGRFEFKNIPFYGLSTFHDGEEGRIRGMNTMYRFTIEGMTLCHCGDLGCIPNQKIINAIKEVDFLFVPVGGTYTLEKPELKQFIEMVNPRIIVPMHYRFGGLTIPIAGVDDFLEMIPEDFIEYVGNSVDIMKDELPEIKECWVFDRR
ncbi:MAG: MBL fold metallo-hydrolase [Candidatus Methanomethylophilaceae archaeon]|nr:MBL fold metallo-hydrolase [Candidatus Methanomethylophilaceae archaeon]MDY5871683.1 MBL fold metallo-hydrolase [Candidatus Methanomethylophilaceae archaeon]